MPFVLAPPSICADLRHLWFDRPLPSRPFVSPGRAGTVNPRSPVVLCVLCVSVVNPRSHLRSSASSVVNPPPRPPPPLLYFLLSTIYPLAARRPRTPFVQATR